MKKESKITTKDGFILDVLETIPDKIDSYLVMCHGLMQNKHGKNDTFIELAEKTSLNNIHVIQFDFRAHGESTGNSLDVTLESLYMDLKAVIDKYIVDKTKKISFFGFSFGGFAVCEYLYKEKIDNVNKVMLISAPVDPYNSLLLFDKGFLNSYYLKKDELFDNPGYIEFKNGWRPSREFFKQIEDYDYKVAISYLPKSTLFLVATNDDAVSPEVNKKYASEYGYKCIEFDSSHSLNSVFDKVIEIAVNYYSN